MQDFALFMAVGFAAQLVDGALGMAYGVVSATALLAAGVPPAAASVSVHASKIFTGAASALSHLAHRNVEFRVWRPLVIGGLAGGCLGALILSRVEADIVKPVVLGWLAMMGGLILWRSWRGTNVPAGPRGGSAPLGFVGGVLDAIGGGGWGPVVTSTLLGRGTPPRLAVGTSNTAEFPVAVMVVLSFALIDSQHAWAALGLPLAEAPMHLVRVGGLVTGGVLAAPLGGWAAKVAPARITTLFVGLLIVIMCTVQLVQLVG